MKARDARHIGINDHNEDWFPFGNNDYCAATTGNCSNFARKDLGAGVKLSRSAVTATIARNHEALGTRNNIALTQGWIIFDLDRG